MLKVIFAFVFTINHLFAQVNWINPYPQANKLNDVQVLGTNVVVAAGAHGTFLRSDNLGNTWKVENVRSDVELTAIHFVNNQNGLIGGKNGTLLKTNNGGDSWDPIPFLLNENILDVQLTLKNEIFVLTAKSIMQTNDSGENWNTLQQADYLFDFKVVNDSTIWSCGDKIYKSTNYGLTWGIIDSNYYSYHSLSAFDENNINFLIKPGFGGLIALRTIDGGATLENVGLPGLRLFNKIHSFGENSIICIGVDNFITYDGGNNWIDLGLRFLESQYTPSLLSVDFNETGNGFIVGSLYDRQTILRTSDYGVTWESYKDFTDASLESISFLDSLNCFVAGTVKDTGKIWHSQNGGKSWSEIYNTIGSGTYINKIRFINEDFGYAAGNSLYVTYDKGISWNVINEPIDYIYDAFFLDDLNGWLVGTVLTFDAGEYREKPIFAKTTDGGINWSVSSFSKNLYSIEFYDSQNGFMACGNGDILGTTNGGNTWNVIYHSDGTSFGDIFIQNETSIYFAGGKGIVLFTNDGGNSWQEKWIGTNSTVYSIEFMDETFGIATSRNKIYYTQDGGMNWRPISLNYENVFLDVGFTSGKSMVVGKNGAIIEIPNSTITNIENKPSHTNYLKGYKLFQNYPNPFNPKTNISFELPFGGKVTLKIFDILGQEIQTVLDKELGAGVHTIEFDGKNLPSGIYFYMISAGNYVDIKKSILLK